MIDKKTLRGSGVGVGVGVGLVWVGVFFLFSGVLFSGEDGAPVRKSVLTPLEQLGKFLFMDTNLSRPPGLACAGCHDPAVGFTDTHGDLPLSEGAVIGEFGTRNSPSAAYAAFVPRFDPVKKTGGKFWDGRTGSLVDQAKLPFLGASEMNNPDKQSVVDRVAVADYAGLFEEIFGPNAFRDVEVAYHNIAVALAAFEESSEVNPFNSKYDGYLLGIVDLTPREQWGEKLFKGVAGCYHCHPIESKDGHPPLFSAFGFHNIGVPQNTEFPYSLRDPIPMDLGLGGINHDPADLCKFRTPGLRNIALSGPYMHNGIFKTLKEVVHFFNTRDVSPHWGPPELWENMEREKVGNLGLTEAEEDALVAFLQTLTDGYPFTQRKAKGVEKRTKPMQ